MKITHHPEPESLMSCSAGSMPEAFAAVMASHISVCSCCRSDLAIMDDMGIALFSNLAPVEVHAGAPVMALRRSEADASSSGVHLDDAVHGDVPAPLLPFVGRSLDAIKWKRLGRGIWHYPLPLSKTAVGDLRLIKVAPGVVLPDHGHGGSELTLVLKGAYSDASGRYGVGDVADLDNTVEHQPVADAREGCICLIASDQKIRFKSAMAKLVQPFTGM
ncbi:MAG: ChrR family anti-sigma-E factor [Hyphomicrobium sp.]